MQSSIVAYQVLSGCYLWAVADAIRFQRPIVRSTVGTKSYRELIVPCATAEGSCSCAEHPYILS